MKINILLPFKEKFDLNDASSVSTTIRNNMKHSKYINDITVYGKNVKNPIYLENFVGITPKKFLFLNKNKFLAKQMVLKILNNKNDRQLVEIHNRPYLFKFLHNSLKKFPISIFFHNNPLDMNGAKKIEQRQYMVDNAAAIFCVSKFIRSKFLEGLDQNKDNVHVLYNGVERELKKFPRKSKKVLFVGKILPEKGVHIFCEAVSQINKIYPNWDFGIIGSGLEKKRKYSFSNLILENFKSLGSNTHLMGLLSNEKVQCEMKNSSIIVVPSIWQEPFGLVVNEAMSNGAAVIASKVGGIPEILKTNGILIEEINVKNLKDAIEYLIKHPKQLDRYQKLSWKNFELSAKTSSKELDNFRNQIIKKYFS